jgi:hypothetical protein
MGRPQHNAKQAGYRRRDIRRDLSEGDVLVTPAPLARGKEATSVDFPYQNKYTHIVLRLKP